jgi:hypothetical protein
MSEILKKLEINENKLNDFEMILFKSKIQWIIKNIITDINKNIFNEVIATNVLSEDKVKELSNIDDPTDQCTFLLENISDESLNKRIKELIPYMIKSCVTPYSEQTKGTIYASRFFFMANTAEDMEMSSNETICHISEVYAGSINEVDYGDIKDNPFTNIVAIAIECNSSNEIKSEYTLCFSVDYDHILKEVECLNVILNAKKVIKPIYEFIDYCYDIYFDENLIVLKGNQMNVIKCLLEI